MLVMFAIMAIKSEAQLINNGASVTIQPGAVVFVAGDVQNNVGSTISNDGKLEVQGNFSNAATYTSAATDDSLILSGGGNVTLNGGTATINYLTINKTANTNNVTLAGTTLLGKKLDYISGSFSTDFANNPTYVFSAPTSAVFNFAAGREINGRVRRTSWVNGSSAVFNQPNMLLATNAGTSPTDVTVTMLPNGDPSLNEREVKRKFLFTQTGGSGFTADIRFPYQDAELNATNMEATLVPWQLISSEWNGKLAPVTRDGSVNYVATTGIAATELVNEWKLADARYTFNATAYLRGAWNGAGAMNASLTSILPLVQPYNDPAFGSYAGSESVAAGFFASHTNIVDWVLVDLRKPASGLGTDADMNSYIGRKAAFVTTSGTLVDLDGVTPLAFDISRQGGGFIVVRHRNHLAMMSNLIASNAAGTFSNNFATVAGVYHNAAITNDPTQLLPASSLYGAWAGNANKDNTVNASDVGLVKSNANASQTGYISGDVNLDGVVNAGDVGVTKISANSSATTHSGRPASVNKEPKGHVPAN